MVGRPGRSTREETDARLKVERDKTDAQLAKRMRIAQGEADAVTKRARTRAAKVLRTARRREDERLAATRSLPVDRARVAHDRSRADAVLRDEYARADGTAARERAARARLVAMLLAHERRDTDRSLLLERAHADEIVARRDDFLAMVSHDLRNELTAVALSVSSLLKNVSDDDAGRKAFQAATNIHRINLRMSRLIADLLDVASIDAGTFTILAERQGVFRTVHDVVESFVPLAAAKRISLTEDVGVHALDATFDHRRIQQVLGNLLTNALQHTAEGGTIAVSAERNSGAIWFHVADSGRGIAAHRLETIFGRFSRGGRREGKGLGLGLYIARRIVEAHGGRIWAESEPGRGSTFHFMLPLSPAARPERHARRRAGLGGRRSPVPQRTGGTHPHGRAPDSRETADLSMDGSHERSGRTPGSAALRDHRPGQRRLGR